MKWIKKKMKKKLYWFYIESLLSYETAKCICATRLENFLRFLQ